jgi:Protein kinase domain
VGLDVDEADRDRRSTAPGRPPDQAKASGERVGPGAGGDGGPGDDDGDPGDGASDPGDDDDDGDGDPGDGDAGDPGDADLGAGDGDDDDAHATQAASPHALAQAATGAAAEATAVLGEDWASGGGETSVSAAASASDGSDGSDGSGAAADDGAASAAASRAPSSAPSQHVDARPSVWATSAARPLTTVAEAFDRSELPRMRMFHIFCIFTPLGAIALSLALGGDPRARALFWAGGVLLAICSAGLAWLSSSSERYRPRPVTLLWILATAGVQPAVYYFGPFSAVVIVQMLGIVFIALGPHVTSARATVVICITTHVGCAVPIVAGWIDDVGVLSAAAATPDQLAIAEVLIVVFLVSSYALGRWARHTSAAAIAELQRAMRVIGDQQQALAEVNDEQARQSRRNEGRWTGQTMGSFRLGLVLGRGAMGEVYEATAADGRLAAVKLLNQRATGSTSLVERFHREMTVAAKLESPHIVRVYELSPPDAPVPFIAMERLHGIDLAARLRAQTRLPSDELVVMLDQVARALEVAQKAGVVHRDLKPHNLFFHEGTTWKVLDFGVSKVLDAGEGTLTGEGIVGTPQYMAPEQASGGSVTHAADVYALGAIAYRCLTGRAPYRGKDLAELVYQVVHGAPVRPSLFGRVPSAVEAVLAVAMAKDPRRRFPSAQALAQAFIAARRGRPVALDPPPNAWL